MEYKLLVENWRQFLTEQESNAKREYVPNYAEREGIIDSGAAALSIFKGAWADLKKEFKAYRAWPQRPITMDWSSEEDGQGWSDSAYSVKNGAVVRHRVNVNPKYISDFYENTFDIVKKYLNVRREGELFEEIKFVIQQVAEICKCLIKPTLAHEILHCKTREDGGAIFGIDISGDQDADYYLKAGENAIRKVERSVIIRQERIAKNIIFESLLPIFLHIDPNDKQGITKSLMKLYNYFKQEIKLNENFFTLRHNAMREREVELISKLQALASKKRRGLGRSISL